MQEIIGFLQEHFVELSLGIVAAILILWIGLWVAKILRKIVENLLRKAELDSTLVSFVGNLTYIAASVFVILAALNQLGVQTASFVAVVGAAGLAIGLALQGSLANFAAGVLLIIFRPFKKGDLIEGGGALGVVEDIQIFTTTLKTPENKTIIVPNAKMGGDNIINYSTKPHIRLDLVYGVGYEADIDRVKAVIADVLNQDERITKDPAPTIGVLELADSSVNFAVRPWVTVADYWDVFFDTNERIKKRFDAEGINIPYPQQDVRMYSAN